MATYKKSGKKFARKGVSVYINGSKVSRRFGTLKAAQKWIKAQMRKENCTMYSTKVGECGMWNAPAKIHKGLESFGPLHAGGTYRIE
jgi:hypothetical protein